MPILIAAAAVLLSMLFASGHWIAAVLAITAGALILAACEGSASTWPGFTVTGSLAGAWIAALLYSVHVADARGMFAAFAAMLAVILTTAGVAGVVALATRAEALQRKARKP